MASKPGRQLKEKSTSSSSTPSTGQRSHKPPGSPDRTMPTSATVKPKSTPSTNAATTTKSTTVSTVNRQPVTKKPAEKPPSPSRRPERTLSTPATNRERSSPKLPPLTTHSPSTRPRTSNLQPSDHKGTKNIGKNDPGTGKPAGTTYTRSKSLEKRTEVVAIPTAFVDTTSSLSDTEALAIKEVPVLALEAKEEHEQAEEVVQEHNPEQVESLVLTSNAEREEETQSEAAVTEDEEGTKEVEVKVEVKPEEVKQEEVEAPMQVDESPKEPVAEQAEEVDKPEIKMVEAKEVPAPRTVAGTKKEVPQRSNDVIEEAKSKFLEKRKNKVLALVGAFETVIALQEPEGGQQGPPPPPPPQQQQTGKEAEEGSSMTSESTE